MCSYTSHDDAWFAFLDLTLHSQALDTWRGSVRSTGSRHVSNVLVQWFVMGRGRVYKRSSITTTI